VPALDIYPPLQAGQYQCDGIATTHVLTDDCNPTHILGYCSLAAAQLQLHDLQPPDRRRLPAYPVPAVRLGRLAVATAARGSGYGTLLLGHA
jgi:predicted GNAT family N-acyltransferase